MADDAREIDLCAAGLDVLDGQAGATGDDAGNGLTGAGVWVGNLGQFESLTRTI